MEQFRVELPPTPRRTRLASRAPTSPGFPPLVATFTFIVMLSYLVLIQPNPDKACPSSDEMNRCFSPNKNSRFVEAVCRNLVNYSTKTSETSNTRVNSYRKIKLPIYFMVVNNYFCTEGLGQEKL